MISKYVPATPVRRAKSTLLLISVAGLLATGRAAESASPTELLEKAVYSEETKGDLDAALQLYRQVIAEGKDTQAVAAQAQYRLGVCLYKKKKFPDATAAFEKLVKDYPDQKELVALAQDYLAGAVTLLPAPWVDGEQLRLNLRFPSGFNVGTVVYGVNSGETNGQKIWHLTSQMFAGIQQISRVEVDAESFKPLHSRWKHTLIGDAEVVYSPGHAEVLLKGNPPSKKIDLAGVIYDNEEAVHLMRRLPLASNYSTLGKVLSALGGGNIVGVQADVTAIEKVEVPAGTFDCYKVELNIKQTFWYSTDSHRYLVKFEGGGVIGELAEISLRKPGEPANYKDQTVKLSFATPPDWLVYRRPSEDPGDGAKIFILDPDAAGVSMVTAARLDKLKSAQKKSVRDWAESQIAEGAKTMKEFKVRPDSWKERTVGGRPALGVTIDYIEGKEKKAGYALYTFGSEDALEFCSFVSADDFEAFLPKFNSIIDSAKID